MKVHPTAIVDRAASLGAGVEVGPYSNVGPQVSVGDGCVIQSHVVLEGAVEIGRKNIIGHGSVIGAPPQDLGFKPETQSRVTIGDDNVIREHCTIHRGTAEGSTTILGDRNFLMVGVHLGHNCRLGNDIIIANNCLLGGYVEVDGRAFLGGASIFHQHVRVGRLVMTQGHSGIGKDVPPFTVTAGTNRVVGVNMIGLRRAGFTGAERDEIKRAFKLLYRSGLNLGQAAEQAAATDFGPNAREFFAFAVSARKRGIVPYRGAGANEE